MTGFDFTDIKMQKGLRARNLINANWCEAKNGGLGTSINPASQCELGSYPLSDVCDADWAIGAARDAFDNSKWPHSPRLRQDVLLEWAARLEKETDSLATLLTLENGKPLSHSRQEILGAISEIKYYAGLTRFLYGRVFEVEQGVFSTLIKEPAGVAAIIVPWNAPAVLLIRSLAPALAAGCTVVIKPAAQTALITAALISALDAVTSLTAGVVNLVFEEGSAVAERLVQSCDVDVVSFTGSNEVGKEIMVAAAATMKKVSLELGGKSSCIIFDDVNIAEVAPALARAATVIAGQQCTAARRVIVHEKKYDEMKYALREALCQLKVGNGMTEGVDMGPLIDPIALEKVEEKIENAKSLADEVILAGGRPSDKQLAHGNFLMPTLVGHENLSASFIQEEIFGPFIVLEKFNGERDAIQRANSSVFGLSASVWTKNSNTFLRVARALKKGTVWQNDHNKLFAEAETGGYRSSGLGRLHGYDGLLDFMETKHIYQNVNIEV